MRCRDLLDRLRSPLQVNCHVLTLPGMDQSLLLPTAVMWGLQSKDSEVRRHAVVMSMQHILSRPAIQQRLLHRLEQLRCRPSVNTSAAGGVHQHMHAVVAAAAAGGSCCLAARPTATNAGPLVPACMASWLLLQTSRTNI